MKTLSDYQQEIELGLQEWGKSIPSLPLYEPIKYILSIGGKRMRPVLTLMAADIFGNQSEQALPAALGVEIFHNFTLLHDDIMDKAPLRRGMATVHEKWNGNSAILSGDAMFVLAVQQVTQTEHNTKIILDLFNKTALEVCEGQQSDMDFENRNNVGLEEYIEMIRLKTAVLLGCALEMGALSVNAPSDDAKHLYAFGENLGIAFQIMDDLLDAFAGEEFGKQRGGDILSLKKTYLMLKAFEKGGESTKEKITSIVTSSLPEQEKIEKVLSIYEELQVTNDARVAMDEYYTKAMIDLSLVQVDEASKQPILLLADYLYNRAI